MRRRERVLQAVGDYWAENHHAPSYQEIADAAGIAHRSVVLYHLRTLRAEGRLTFKERRTRTVRLVPQKERAEA